MCVSWGAASQVVLVVKKALPATSGVLKKRLRFDPWVGKIPRGGGHSNPLQYSCLENPLDGRRWQAIVHRVAESDMNEVT